MTEHADHGTLGRTAARASQLLRGDRMLSYGDPKELLAHASLIATGILKEEVSPEHIVIIMLAVKLAREQHKHAPDNLIDAAAYADILNHLREQT